MKISFDIWLTKLRDYLIKEGYDEDIKGFLFEDTAYQDYDLGLSPERSAKIFIEEWKI